MVLNLAVEIYISVFIIIILLSGTLENCALSWIAFSILVVERE